jgi:hypothetical protein
MDGITNPIRIAGRLSISVFNIALKTEDSTFAFTRLFCSNFESISHSLNVQNFRFNIFLLLQRLISLRRRGHFTDRNRRNAVRAVADLPSLSTSPGFCFLVLDFCNSRDWSSRIWSWLVRQRLQKASKVESSQASLWSLSFLVETNPSF